MVVYWFGGLYAEACSGLKIRLNNKASNIINKGVHLWIKGHGESCGIQHRLAFTRFVVLYFCRQNQLEVENEIIHGISYFIVRTRKRASCPGGLVFSDNNARRFNHCIFCGFVEWLGWGYPRHRTEHGFIRRTTDGGTTWSMQKIPVTDRINRIIFVSPTTGFAAGGSGAILKTTDGGSSWMLKRSGGSVNSIFFDGGQHGWACGTDSVLFTTDQGETWSSRLADGATALWDVSFRTLQEGWAVGIYGDCYNSEDGGYSWASATPPISGVSLFGICFPTPSRGIVVGGGQIALSTDAGASWTSVYNTGGSQMNAISLSDSLHGWAVASDEVLKTVDGGVTWAEQPLPTSAHYYLQAVNSLDSNHGWIAGDGTILRTVDGGGTLPPVFFAFSGGIDFGDVSPGETKKDSVPIMNQGAGSLIVSSIISSNAKFTVSPLKLDIAPSHAQYVNVIFAPIDTLKQVGYIVFTDNGLSSPDSVLVMGNNGTTGIRQDAGFTHKGYFLSANYPNPFNPTTTIAYQLPSESFVTLIVYDALGSDVRVLVNERQGAGNYSVIFNGSNHPSGVYFYVLHAGAYHETRKLLLIK